MTPAQQGSDAVVLTVVCTDDDPRGFCRQLSGAVAPTEWVLARAFAVARQVHPQHPDALGTMATLMHCEFRLPSAPQGIGDDQVEALRQRLNGFETFGLQRITVSGDAVPPLLRP